MTWSFTEWTPDDEPGEVVPLASAAQWQALLDFYTRGTGSQPLERVFEIARGHGVRSAVVERRYVDADWRSEHARFYGATFRRYPSVCHRLHFFTREVPADFDAIGDLQEAYRGYTVMRPLPFAPVGRTMIAPPAELNGAVQAAVEQTVHLFGWPLTVKAMPFISQDAQYLRCAHASIWMVLRHAELAHGLPRRLPEDIQQACSGGVVVGRQVPSSGLSVPQMLAGMSRLGLAPNQLKAPDRYPADNITLYGILCRYINSGLPPIVVSSQHAWVVVAWKRSPSAGHPELTVWRHDDSAGPYMRVEDPWDEPAEAHRPWVSVLPPLLSKMYIDAERAENMGRLWLESFAASGTEHPLSAGAQAADALTFRTYAVLSNDYKARLFGRGLHPDLVRLYRLAQMPRYIWVIEAVDRVARAAGGPDVLGELLLDATMSEASDFRDPGVVGLRLEMTAFTTGPDHQTLQQLQLPATGPYLSDLFAR